MLHASAEKEPKSTGNNNYSTSYQGAGIGTRYSTGLLPYTSFTPHSFVHLLQSKYSASHQNGASGQSKKGHRQARRRLMQYIWLGIQISRPECLLLCREGHERGWDTRAGCSIPEGPPKEWCIITCSNITILNILPANLSRRLVESIMCVARVWGRGVGWTCCLQQAC